MASAPDVSTALAQARKAGGAVEIASMRTDTTSTYENPDGTRSLRYYARPIWGNKDGQKVPLDTSLVKSGGLYRPAAPAYTSTIGQQGPVAAGLSDSTFAAVSVPYGSLKLGWPSATLPTPTVSGSTARFANAAPGEDVTATSTPGGLEFSVVYTSRPKAGAGVVQISVSSPDLRLEQDGPGVDLLSERAGKVGTIGAPTLYDAQTDGKGHPINFGAAAISVADGPPGTWILTLTPDSSFLANPATAFPVTMDPTIDNVSGWEDTYVAQNDAGAEGSGRYDYSQLGIGDLVGSTDPARTLLKTGPSLPGAPTNGQFISATVYLKLASGSNNPLRVAAVASGWDQTSVTWAQATNPSFFVEDKNYAEPSE